MSKKIKILAIAVAFVLVLGVAVGGTIAWLTDKTEAVTNTFTMGDIQITLIETASTINDGDSDENTNTFKMVPGATIAKDPKITVLADSEDCWLFVKIEEENDFDTFMTYEIADGWTALDGVDGVYYRDVNASNTNQPFTVLKNNNVTVKDTATRDDFEDLDTDYDGTVEADEMPTLKFTAYAIQMQSIDNAADAWDARNP